MPKKTQFIFLTGTAFMLTAALFLGIPQLIHGAEKCHIVTLFDRDKINSTDITVAKGDCILWVCWKKDSDVTLTFKEGEKCIRAIHTSVGFAMDESSGCFISQTLSYGQNVSLVFKEAGTYTYDVHFEVGGKARCTVVVTEQ